MVERAGRLVPVFGGAAVAGRFGGGLALPLGALSGAVLRQHISDYLIPGEEGMTTAERIDTAMREAVLGLLRRAPRTVVGDIYNARPYVEDGRNILDSIIGPSEPRPRGLRQVWPKR